MNTDGSSTGANQGGSSSPNPNPNESPRRRQPPSGSPARGRGSPARTPPRPVMGVPGVSAFHPYTRTPPQTPPRGGGQFLPAAAPMPVGGGGAIVIAPGGLRFGGSPLGKRPAPGGGGDLVASGGGGAGEHPCTVCGREFLSPKALFGHMRSHPDRGWKGAHPPPTFRAEEEFADIEGINRAEEVAADADHVEGGGAEENMEEADAAAAGKEGGQEEEAGGGEGFRVPDLNSSPPEDSK